MYHPEMEGDTECVIIVLEQYLWCFINFQQNNWVDLLALVDFAYNNVQHASTHISPFLVTYGFHPRLFPLALSDSGTSHRSSCRNSQLCRTSWIEPKRTTRGSQTSTNMTPLHWWSATELGSSPGIFPWCRPCDSWTTGSWACIQLKLSSTW